MSRQNESGPLIGVTSKKGSQEWIGKNVIHYIDALRKFGARAVILSPDASTGGSDQATCESGANGAYWVCMPDEGLPALDGLILSGGGDVHPRHFGEEIDGADPDSIDLKRDELELKLARRALKMELPTFGICRGCQVLNVAAGGAMVQDLPGHRSSKENPALHPVSLCQGSLTQRILGSSPIDVNTYHHQGIDGRTLAPALQAAGSALPDSWLLEAFESPAHRWVIGVQWHPERLFELPDGHRLLWESFIETCGT